MPRLKQAAKPAEAKAKEDAAAAVDDGVAPAALAPAEITAEDIVGAVDPNPTAAAGDGGGVGAKEAGFAPVVAVETVGKGDGVGGDVRPCTAAGSIGAGGAQDVSVAAEPPAPAVAPLALAAPDPSTMAMPTPVPAAPGLPLPVPHTVTLGGKSYQFGISQSALLAPVPVPPKKKPKTQEEFTIHEKLAILAELDDPRMTVPNLAARHNTSRTSIYRWKRDILRLQKLAGKQGKGQYKRVPHKRKAWNEEFTAAEKLAVVRELNGEDAPSVKELAEKLGTNHRSLYRWKKDEARLTKLVEEEGRGDWKRVGSDPLHRVKEALKVFHKECYESPSEGEALRIITGTVVASKAKQICEEMLREHDANPFLREEEAKGMRDFRASTSWGRKLVVKMGWNVKPFADAIDETKEGATDVAAAEGVSPRGTKRPAALAATKAIEAEAKSGYIDFGAKRGPKPTRPDKPRELKRELALTKKKLNYANWNIRKLQAENKALKDQLAALNGGGEGGDDVAANGQPSDGIAEADPEAAPAPVVNNESVAAPVVDSGGLAAQADSTVVVEDLDPAPVGDSVERAASAFVESLTAQDDSLAAGLVEGAMMDAVPPGSIEV